MRSKRYRRARGVITRLHADAAGFTLVELVVTLVVLSILSIGVAPLVKTAVKRQREQQLRESLREMREAIKQFKYDTDGTPQLCAQGANTQQQQQFQPSARSRVVVSDCKLFTTDNYDYYAPTLETLVEGANVIPRGGAPATGGAGIGNNQGNTATSVSTLATKKKVYLRNIPTDPMTGETDWVLRSCYQEADDNSWDRINVFDVRSASDEEALDGSKYSDW